jgi:hypothetical protein
MQKLSDEELEIINEKRKADGLCPLKCAYQQRTTIALESGKKRKISFNLNNPVYGAGVKKLAKILNVTEEEARELKKKHFKERTYRK